MADRARDLLTSGRACVRVAVDAAVPADARTLADLVAADLAAEGRPVLRVHAEDFLRPRSVRLEHGPHDADAGYERWVDHLALRREVLDPLGPDGDLRWLPTLWDPVTDRATRAPREQAAPGSTLVVDGPFLLRWETADAVDVGVHLQAGDAALARRLAPDDLERVRGAWARYTEETWPADRADLVARVEHPDRPALVVARMTLLAPGALGRQRPAVPVLHQPAGDRDAGRELHLAGLRGVAQLVAGEPARLGDLDAVDLDVRVEGRRRSNRSSATPGTATAGCPGR